MLIVSIAVIIWGLVSGWRRHRNLTPLLLGSAAGVALFIFSFLHAIRTVAYASIATLVVASVLNVVLLKRPRVVAGST